MYITNVYTTSELIGEGKGRTAKWLREPFIRWRLRNSRLCFETLRAEVGRGRSVLVRSRPLHAARPPTATARHGTARRIPEKRNRSLPRERERARSGSGLRSHRGTTIYVWSLACPRPYARCIDPSLRSFASRVSWCLRVLRTRGHVRLL